MNRCRTCFVRRVKDNFYALCDDCFNNGQISGDRQTGRTCRALRHLLENDTALFVLPTCTQVDCLRRHHPALANRIVLLRRLPDRLRATHALTVVFDHTVFEFGTSDEIAMCRQMIEETGAVIR